MEHIKSGKNDIDLVLAFCPLFQTTEPHIAIAHLAAHMEARGIRTQTRELNIEFFQRIRELNTLSFLRDLFLEKISHIQKSEFINQHDYLKTHIALAAIDSIVNNDLNLISLQNWSSFCKKVYAIQAALGFETVVQNDFEEFVDDLYTFNNVKELPRDNRLEPSRLSTIAETVTLEHLKNRDHNLFLRLYEYLFIDSLIYHQPLAIGLSIATNEQIIQALSLGTLIKEHAPNIHVVAGGSYIRYLGKTDINKLLNLNSFDSIAIGQEENALESLVNSLKFKIDKNNIPGLIRKPHRPTDDYFLQLPSNHHIDQSYWQISPRYENLRSFIDSESTLSILTSIGCYWSKCKYCNYIGIIEGKKKCVFKPPVILVNEILESNKTYNIHQFNLISECISPSYANQVSDLLIEKNAKVLLSCWARPEREFDEALCKKMYRAGFRFITIGVESLSDRILKLYNKGTTSKIILNTIKKMTNSGIKIQVNVILGLPTETVDEALETYTITNNELRFSNIYRLVTFPFSVQQKSFISNNPSQFGISIDPDKNEAFRPKNIFVRFSYVDENMFNKVYALGCKYHKSVKTFNTPIVKPLYFTYPKVGSSFLNFSFKDEKEYRIPAYLFVNFENGIAKTISSYEGFIINESRRTGVPFSLNINEDLVELFSAGIIQ